MLPIKKIYIDSRFKSADSKSDSDFHVDLPQNMLMPDGCGFYLDDVSIPVSWYPIIADRNDHLYYKVDGAAGVVVVPEGNYNLGSLNTAIVNQLNAGGIETHFVANALTLTNEIEIQITVNKHFSILTDTELASEGFSPTNARSINNVLRNFAPKVNTQSDPYISGYIDLVSIRNVYIIAHGLGNFNTMSVSGERAIVKKVPVTAGYGEIIHDQNVIGIDYLDCSRQTLSRLSFQLKDVFGNVIGLNGQHWSFSIVFSRISENM